MTRVVVHIERLVLRGPEQADGAALAAGLESELKRLLARPGAQAALTRGGDRRKITAGKLRAEADRGDGALGRAAGRRLVKGLGA